MKIALMQNNKQNKPSFKMRINATTTAKEFANEALSNYYLKCSQELKKEHCNIFPHFDVEEFIRAFEDFTKSISSDITIKKTKDDFRDTTVLSFAYKTESGENLKIGYIKPEEMLQQKTKDKGRPFQTATINILSRIVRAIDECRSKKSNSTNEKKLINSLLENSHTDVNDITGLCHVEFESGASESSDKLRFIGHI